MSKKNRRRNKRLATRQINVKPKEENNVEQMNKNETYMDEKKKETAEKADRLADWTELRTLPVGVLKVDPGYQRFFDRGWAKWIASHFNPILLQVLQVSYRDGEYWTFDGQHSTEAIKMKFKDENYPVVCKVYHGLTREEESKLFYEFNTCRKRMNSADMLKSQIMFGDEKVCAFLEATKKAGFLIDPVKRVNTRYSIRAIHKAQKCFEDLGSEQYERMLKILKDTWNGDQWSVNLKMLGGMSTLIKVYGEKLDDRRFISQLRRVTENQIVREAGRFYEESVPVAYASSLITFYNKGMRGGKLKRALLLGD